MRLPFLLAAIHGLLNGVPVTTPDRNPWHIPDGPIPAPAWTFSTDIVATWDGEDYPLPAQSMNTYSGCMTLGQQLFFQWADKHRGATLKRWGCTSKPETST